MAVPSRFRCYFLVPIAYTLPAMIERRRAEVSRQEPDAEPARTTARPQARLPLEAGNGAISRLLRHGHGPASVSDDFTSRLGTEGGHEIPNAPRQDLES